jgi:hypothetical protein
MSDTEQCSHSDYQEILRHKIGILERQKALRKVHRVVNFVTYASNELGVCPIGLELREARLKAVLAETEADTQLIKTQFEDMLGVVKIFPDSNGLRMVRSLTR